MLTNHHRQMFRDLSPLFAYQRWRDKDPAIGPGPKTAFIWMWLYAMGQTDNPVVVSSRDLAIALGVREKTAEGWLCILLKSGLIAECAEPDRNKRRWFLLRRPAAVLPNPKEPGFWNAEEWYLGQRTAD